MSTEPHMSGHDPCKRHDAGIRRQARLLAVGLGLAAAVSAASALGCDELLAQIERKIRSNGVAEPRLVVLDAAAAASAPGRVVGSCDRGARRIVRQPERAGTPLATGRDEGILTECKDGRVLRGGSCRP